jgi:hypothetical protein
MIPLDMRSGTIHKTNSFGDIRIVKYTTSFEVDVEFLMTKSKAKTASSMIRRGAVRDKFSPSVCGFGYVGIGRYKARYSGKDSRAYVVWHDMIVRCYSKKKLSRSPTYKDCTVCDEWANFQNFADWFDSNYVHGMQLDKDKMSNGSKLYSPETCCFISSHENTSIARAKKYKMINPSGDVVNIYNMREFCRVNNLNPSYMISVCKGNKRSYKGWYKA